MYTKSPGFSLVELMVTVGMISILSVIAIPSYKEHVLRAEVVKGVEFLRQIEKTYFQAAVLSGIRPSTIQFKDVTIDGTEKFYENGKYGILLDYSTASNPFFAFRITDLGVDGNIFLRLHSTQNKSFCGAWGEASKTDLPLTYLPSGCNCTQVSTVDTCTPSASTTSS